MPKSVLLDELFRLMECYKFQPSKKKSQHFLINPNAIVELVQAANVSKKNTVLEIGPGTGFITRALLDSGARVVACELDEVFCDMLARELPQERLRIIQGNFLKAELPPFNKVCCAPPYGISSEIMERLFERKIDSGALLFQKEFVERLTAIPGVRDYSALSVLGQHYFELNPLNQYSPENFFPTPRTYSQIVQLRSRNRPHSIAFNHFVSELFRYKNKNAQKSFKHAQPFLEKTIGKPRSPSIPPEFAKKKVDLLEVAEFVELFNALYG